MAERLPAHHPVSSPTDAKRASKVEEHILAELASEGLVTRGEGAMTAFRPLRLTGKPLSDTLLEDRTDRL